jgi:hypothetical protein
MKTLINFFNSNPSYFKVSTARIASRTNLTEKTVIRFKKTPEYRLMKSMYINTLKK